jgi:uncharacterized membrane protein YdjX (TVP38/TMEM64 family)
MASASVDENARESRAGGPRWRRWPRVALVVFVVAAIATFYLTGLWRYVSWDSIRANLDVWQGYVARHLLQAVLVFFLVYTAITALSLPAAAAMTLLAGALFGRWLGTATVSVASTLGATLAFLGSRYLFRDWVQGRYGERLRAINQGIERDGAFYLFMLRLVPLVPFFLINLGMGLTPIRVGTYVLTSWVGMLLGTFLYVNAGTAIATIDSPGDVLSPTVLISLAALGIVPLAIRKLFQSRIRARSLALGAGLLLAVAIAAIAGMTYLRYRVAETMSIPNREYSNAEYPDDPAGRSVHFGQYSGRSLRLVRKDATHFDFVLEPREPHVARVVFRDIDASLMTPSIPEWTRDDADLVRIALTDRQWNRQQVRFDVPSPQVEITGGDGFETESLYSAELAKNCLNAGLWEVLLFAKEGDGKALYYQTWFTFPLGYYKAIFEHNTHLPYWQHWYYLEHWFDPAGTPVPLEKLREVKDEREAAATFDPAERILFAGEQIRKRRTTIGENIITWGDFFGPRRVRFATFVPPGKYDLNRPWKNQYWRIDQFQKAILRKIVSPADSRPHDELELVFASSRSGEVCRFIVSGFDLSALAQLRMDEYPKGLYMPMGIGVPPFYQTYDALRQAPPEASPYFSVMLDGEGRWIDHHSLAVDGPVLHRDEKDPGLLHVYLLSYERHSLVSHIVVSTH